jgi:large subunit ribosomal protein L28
MIATNKAILKVKLPLTAASNCAFNLKPNAMVRANRKLVWTEICPLSNSRNDPLTSTPKDGKLGGFFDMKVCEITGSRAVRGSVIHRRGLAKKKGGVGRHITKMVPRTFVPNLRRQRIWVPELKKFVRVRVTARGLKTINKRGAYKALKKAGAI